VPFILGNSLYEYLGSPEIINTSSYKVLLASESNIIELTTESELDGIVVVGSVEVIVDTLIHTKTYGSVGDTIQFRGSNLVIIGLKIAQLRSELREISSLDKSYEDSMIKAKDMIKKINKTITDPKTQISFEKEGDEKIKHFIFGRRNFLLIGSDSKFVLIHRKQVSIKEAESKLIQIDPETGILIANYDKIINIGRGKKDNYSFLGKLGVNIATSVLNEVLWD